MSRKGRCSNLPANCELAKNGTLLPFAGIGSICPECGAPLALMSHESAADPKEFRPQSSQRFEGRFPSEPDPKPSNTLFNAGLIAALVIGLGLLAFIGAKLLRGGEHNVTTSQMSASASFDPAQVAAIEPSIIARASSNLDVKNAPDASAQSVTNLGIGSVVDITGRVNINNTFWVRINVPNQPTMSGYVLEDQLLTLSGGSIAATQPLDNSLIGNNIAPSANVPPPPPVIGEIVEMGEKVVYIQSNRANIRAEAGPEATRIGEALRGDTLSIDASRTHNGKTWYRATLPNGSKGWISASLVGNSAPAPIPEVVEPEVKTPAVISSSPKSITEGSRVVITSANVAVHSAASPEDETKIASAERGNVLQITEITQSGGQTWYKVKSNRFGIDGWIPASAAKPVE